MPSRRLTLGGYLAHNGMVEIGEDKMGKSDGNAVNIRSFRMADMDPNVIRYWILSASYRKPLSVTSLNDGTAIRQWLTLRERLKSAPEEGISEEFEAAMDEDLNTPAALSALLVRPTLQMSELLGFRLLPDEEVPAAIMALAEEREVLRRERKWTEADAVKKKIVDAGYEIRDRPNAPSIVTKK